MWLLSLQAEERLEHDGDFLVRESNNSPGQYVLSGRQNGLVKHLLLVDPEGVVSASVVGKGVGALRPGHSLSGLRILDYPGYYYISVPF